MSVLSNVFLYIWTFYTAFTFLHLVLRFCLWFGLKVLGLDGSYRMSCIKRPGGARYEYRTLIGVYTVYMNMVLWLAPCSYIIIQRNFHDSARGEQRFRGVWTYSRDVDSFSLSAISFSHPYFLFSFAYLSQTELAMSSHWTNLALTELIELSLS